MLGFLPKFWAPIRLLKKMGRTTCCTQMAMGRGTKINTCHTRSVISDQSAAAALSLSWRTTMPAATISMCMNNCTELQT